MCGIAGFVGTGGREILERMTRSLRHRGPDEEGFFFMFSGACPVALGSRRLSIIDLRGGRQPIANEDNTIHVILNGEIYNFQELRKQLESRHTFTTHTDTEVIVHLYEEKGEACVQELEGMFAFALWDARKNKLLLARDRFGEKPLFYAHAAEAFLFGSELKALMEHPLFQREMDTSSLEKYFIYEHIPAPHTIFKNVFKLPAAHYLVLENGKSVIKEYWNIADVIQDTCLSERGALELLDKKLDAAVQKMLVADVPLGMFLSGGIDSSTIAYYAQQSASRPIKTFSIGFDDAAFDESRYAGRVAKRLGTDHYMRMFKAAELEQVVRDVYGKLDEPLADPSLVPTYLLSCLAREHVTVALSGDGSDELFMGYQTFLAQRIAALYGRVPRGLRRVVEKIALSLPTSFSYLSIDYRAKKFVEGFEYPPLVQNQLWIGAFSPREAEMLLGRAVRAGVFEDIYTHAARVASYDSFHQLSYLYQKQYLQDFATAKVDRASMMASLEARSPFLDADLAAFAFSLPLSMKLRGMTGKYILRRLMAPRLGGDIAWRAKKGFQPPIARWLARDFRRLVDEYLSGARLQSTGVFNAAYVRQLIAEHQNYKVDHRKKLWSLLVFQMWKEKFIV